MFQVERVELLNWDIQANQILVLRPGVNLITGENGSGKTAILDGIKVALGAGRIGADRSYNDYLRLRDEPVAMIRLVASNRADPATGKRPFDVLGGGFDSDQVSVASVFHASDEGYPRKDYILDGDRSPLALGVEARPFERRSDFRARLEKLGMGRSFRTLITTPQGEVASLCRRSPGELFNLLFDFIGGKEALEEWERLRRDYEVLERKRQEEEEALEECDRRLVELRKREEVHLRYLEHRREAMIHRLVLPLVRRSSLERSHLEILAGAESLESQAREADLAYTEVLASRDQARAELATARKAQHVNDEQLKELRRSRDELRDELATARAKLKRLEDLRRRAEGLPERDLAALRARTDALRTEVGGLDHELETLRERRGELHAEMEQVKQGVLPPPPDVRRFREVLQREKVPHQLLLDLVEPIDADSPDRRALESFLGDLRLAVAVPDVASFTRAVALARAHCFRFHVLAPDVRSRRPVRGEHPLLEGVRVKDPRYQGLVIRLLRRIRRLGGDEEVRDTFREGGALVSPDGFVLDRLGGIHKGTDRFYLGRDALKRRRQEIEEALDELSRREAELHHVRRQRAGQIDTVEQHIRQEQHRLQWLEARAEHARVQGEEQRLEQRRAELERREDQADARRRELQQRVEDLTGRIGGFESRASSLAQDARGRREDAGTERARADGVVEELALAAENARAAERELRGSPADVIKTVEQQATEGDPRAVSTSLGVYLKELDRYTEDDRDENLPANVRTQERQVMDVRGELERIGADAQKARQAAEQAHEQYRRITHRVFRRYFARLANEAQRIGFRVEGQLRVREDGRFDVDLKVGVGDKPPVPYGSASLSGGEKAAMSILMGMSTMNSVGRVGSGFFIVDEPFSASDTHKIQELGAFLGRTGAQYLVSMPSSKDITHCGAWLQAVLTCTRTTGGVDESNRLRLAPPVKCSYVVHDEQAEQAEQAE